MDDPQSHVLTTQDFFLTPTTSDLTIHIIVPDLFKARVIDNFPSADDQTLLRLDVPTDVWSSHIWHSQYVELILPGMPPWHATIANRPGFELFEFLVKDAGERSHRITNLKADDELEISKPMGPGFPILAYRNHDVILAASGVAICAMRPMIQEIIINRADWGNVLLFYGERTADTFAFGEERELWREGLIDIYLSASRPGEGTTWKGHVGYVQDYLVQVKPEVKNTVAFLAGRNDMINDFTDVLLRMGMPINMIFLNT
jgi:NAD(P)H-flavin reductase